jgi:hypothetical protein
MTNFEGKQVKPDEIDSSVIISLETIDHDIELLSSLMNDENKMNGKIFVESYTDNKYYYCDNEGEWYILRHGYALSGKYERDKCINRSILFITCPCCFWNPCYYLAWVLTETCMNIDGEYDEEIFTYVKSLEAKTLVTSQIKSMLELNEKMELWRRKIVI